MVIRKKNNLESQRHYNRISDEITKCQEVGNSPLFKDLLVYLWELHMDDKISNLITELLKNEITLWLPKEIKILFTVRNFHPWCVIWLTDKVSEAIPIPLGMNSNRDNRNTPLNLVKRSIFLMATDLIKGETRWEGEGMEEPFIQFYLDPASDEEALKRLKGLLVIKMAD